MDDAHSALLIISTIIVLFINFSIHSFNSALRELSNSDIEENNKEDRKEYRLKYFLEKYDDLKVEEIKVPENVIVSKDEFGGTYISYKNQYLDGFYIAKLKKAKK